MAPAFRDGLVEHRAGRQMKASPRLLALLRPGVERAEQADPAIGPKRAVARPASRLRRPHEGAPTVGRRPACAGWRSIGGRGLPRPIRRPLTAGPAITLVSLNTRQSPAAAGRADRANAGRPAQAPARPHHQQARGIARRGGPQRDAARPAGRSRSSEVRMDGLSLAPASPAAERARGMGIRSARLREHCHSSGALRGRHLPRAG